MKYLAIFLLVVVAVLSVLLWRSNEHRPKPIDLTPIHQNRDSLNHVILATQDTLNAIRNVLDGKMRELANARLNSLKTTKEHDQIRFVNFTDSARVSALSELYPSFRIPR